MMVKQGQFEKEKKHAENLEQKMKMLILENDKLLEGIVTSEQGRSIGFDSPDRYQQSSTMSRRIQHVGNAGEDLARQVEEQKSELELLRRERQQQKNAEVEFEQMSAILEERCQLLLDENQNLQDLLSKAQEAVPSYQQNLLLSTPSISAATAYAISPTGVSGQTGTAEEWQRLKERVKQFEDQQQPIEDRQKALKAQNANLLKKIELLESSVKDYQQQISFLQSTRDVQILKEAEAKDKENAKKQDHAQMLARIEREKLEKVNAQLTNEVNALRLEKQRTAENKDEEMRLLKLQTTLMDMESKLISQSAKLQEKEAEVQMTSAQLRESASRVSQLEAQLVATEVQLREDLRRALSTQSDEQKRQREEENQKLAQQRSEEFALLEKKHTTLRSSYISLEMENKQIGVMKAKVQELEAVKSELLNEKSVFLQEKGTFLIQSKQREEHFSGQLNEKSHEILQLKERAKLLNKEIEVLSKVKVDSSKTIERLEKELAKSKDETVKYSQNLVSVTNELTKLNGGYAALQNEHAKVLDAQKKLVREHEKVSAESAQRAKELAKAKQSGDVLNTAYENLKQQQAHSVAEIDRLSKELAKAKGSNDQLSANVEKNAKEITVKANLLESLKAQLERTIKELTGQNAVCENLNAKLKNAEENLYLQDVNGKTLQGQVAKLEGALKECQTGLANEEAKHIVTGNSLKRVESSLQSANVQLANAMTRLQKTEESLKKSEEQLKKTEELLKKTEGSLKAEVSKVASCEETIRGEEVAKKKMEELVYAKFTEKKAQVKQLEDTVSALKENIGVLEGNISELNNVKGNLESKLKESKEAAEETAKHSKRDFERIASELKVASARCARFEQESLELRKNLGESLAEGSTVSESLAKREKHLEKAIAELTRMDEEKIAVIERNRILEEQLNALEGIRKENETRIESLSNELKETINVAKERRGKDSKEFNRKLQVLQNQISELERAKKDMATSFNAQVKDNMTQLQSSIKLYQEKIEELEKAGEKSAKQAKIELNTALAINSSRIQKSDVEKQEILKENALLNELLVENQGRFQEMQNQIVQLNSQVDGLKAISDAKKNEINQLQTILRQKVNAATSATSSSSAAAAAAASTNGKVVKKKPVQQQTQPTQQSESSATPNQSNGSEGMTTATKNKEDDGKIQQNLS